MLPINKSGEERDPWSEFERELKPMGRCADPLSSTT